MRRFGQDRSRVGFPRHVLSVGLLLAGGLLSACQTTQVTPTPPVAKAPEAPVVQQTAPVPPPVAAPVVQQQTRVAILLPLSGQSASVGQSLLNAAQMAFFDMADTTYTLMPFDTLGTADGAATAAQQAIAQGAQIVLGPLFSQSVTAAAAVTKAANVPMISYSTNPDVAEANVYVTGFLLRDQARRVVEESLGRGLARFALLTPDTPYGRLMATAFTEVVASKAPQASLVMHETYDPTNVQGMTQAAKRLLPSADTPPQFDAVMIAESGPKLHEVLELLAYAGLNPVQTKVLGPMLWDDPQIFNERMLQGAWFPVPPPASHQGFARRYQALFGQPAPSIAGLAYDTTALTVVLGRQPLAAGQTTPFTPAALTSASGFAGVEGVFRLRPDGFGERGLAIMEIANGTARQIGEAPTSFAADPKVAY